MIFSKVGMLEDQEKAAGAVEGSHYAAKHTV